MNVTHLEPVTDAFALRSNERCTYHGEEYPEGLDRVLGIMRRSVFFPGGPYQETCLTPENKGLPVEFEAIIACERVDVGWIWVHLSPSTKEQLGSMLDKWGAVKDKWNFVSFQRHDA